MKRFLKSVAGLLALATLVVVLVLAFGERKSPTDPRLEVLKLPEQTPMSATEPPTEMLQLPAPTSPPTAEEEPSTAEEQPSTESAYPAPEVAALSSPYPPPATAVPTSPPYPAPIQPTATIAIPGAWRVEKLEVTSEGKALEVPKELLSEEGTRLVNPQISSDGKQILFERYTGKRIRCSEESKTCSYPQAELWLYSLDGSWLKLDGPAILGSWSPDGQRIAYLGQVGPGKYDLRWMMIQEGEPVSVAKDVKWAKPHWRSKEEIVYLEREGAISLVNLNGSEQKVVSPIKMQKLGGPESFALAGDGETLVVVKEKEVWLVSLNRDQEPKVLTSPNRELSFSNIIGGMAWSQDGRYIALSSNNGYIVIYDREGRFISAPAIGGEAIYSLSWSPDGSSVAALAQNRSSKDSLYQVVIANTDGSVIKTLKLIENYKYTMDWSPTGFLVWTTDDQQVPYILEMSR